jgi:tRNA (guanine37-N1)-methyltransferase
MYKKAGFRLRPDRRAPAGAVVLTKKAGTRAGQRISR